MKFMVDVKADKHKEFLQLLEALRGLRVVKSVEVMEEKEQGKSGAGQREESPEVSSREMASQYRDLVD